MKKLNNLNISNNKLISKMHNSIPITIANRTNISTSKYINICLVGCVSAGKSTILNALFSNNYAQCKIKRTTMMPNKFMEVHLREGKLADSHEIISETIANVNQQIYNQIARGQNFNLNDYGNELTFYVDPMEMNMEMNMDSQIKICIYDIPGMNDSKSKSVYYNYLETNFHKFNIILFVIDIQSGMNTSDSMDILEFLSRNIAKHKIESNKNIGLLSIINKADSMQLDGNKLKVLGELGEMFEQSVVTIEQKFSDYSIQSNLLGIIPVCGLDSNLYRMIKKYKDITKLSEENILRIGINEEGSKFRCVDSNEQKRKVQQIICNEKFVDDMLILSGFSQIEQALKSYINLNGLSMIIDNLLWEYDKLPEIIESNLFENIKERIQILENIFYYSLEKYSELVKKIIKRINTIVYKKISTMANPNQIKEYYDSNILEQINLDNNIKFHLSKYFDYDVYPNYLTDRILELVIIEYKSSSISLSKLQYIELFYLIGKLNENISDILIQNLMENPYRTDTFMLDNLQSEIVQQKIISLIDKLKFSKMFINFLRFLLANIYTNFTEPANLIEKIFLFDKHGEVHMKQFINDLRINRKLNRLKSSNTFDTSDIFDTNKHLFIYTNSNITENSTYNPTNCIELYYINQCRKLNNLSK